MFLKSSLCQRLIEIWVDKHTIYPPSPPCDSPLVQMAGGSFPTSNGGTAGFAPLGSTPRHAPTVTSGGTTGRRVIPTAHGKITDKTLNAKDQNNASM